MIINILVTMVEAQKKILQLKQQGNIFLVKISQLEKPLKVNKETVYNFRLVEGIVLTPSQYEQLIYEAEVFACDKETVRLLTMRSHSIGELKNKLKRKKFCGDIIEKTIKKYKRLGYLDDYKYAYDKAQKVVTFRPCGKSFLMAYLQKKMIERSLAAEIAEAVLSEESKEERALRALRKRWHEFKQFELEVARKKSYNYLSRRGFGYEESKKAWEQLLKVKDEELNY
ncbi:MAG: regulatory protein RecX [FCB group bacterium]|nr:regulatory protein RecX [FCB group bacterium]